MRLLHSCFSVLGQLSPRKIGGPPPPNPKTNSKPNPNPNPGGIFLWGNCLVAPPPPTLKLTLTLTQSPTLAGDNFPWGAIARILCFSVSYAEFLRILLENSWASASDFIFDVFKSNKYMKVSFLLTVFYRKSKIKQKSRVTLKLGNLRFALQ